MVSLQLPMVLAVFFLQLRSGVYSSTFTIRNKCDYPVWPGILSVAGTPELSTTGFLLQPGESSSLSVPTSWSGRLGGRTLCTQDSFGKFSCLTGDCGSSTMECAGGGAAPPATLAKFTLNCAGGLDFYEFSLVNRYNLPMMVAPQGGTGGNCSSTGCAIDLNKDCPVELKIIDGSNEGVACKSAGDAFGDAQYCCRGAHASPDTCKPNTYSEFFKNACPQVYSYAYDDVTSTSTCAGADFIVTFCPGLSTRLNLIPNAAKPVLKDTAAKTRPCSIAPTTATGHVVHALPRNPRRLLAKPSDVNFHAPPSTSNEKSWNLDKLDPPSPPAPTGNRPIHH
ncbi:hypothetical protein SLEP1_g58307 [Rubroshorea leprosula]|uniref:Thaumatin-like protein n=1 Tax=Rubroshorea leprosula TaxID=152421 RepID=A0AAV5MQ43_9ROSI|nr:hypothetical protein SLEP1_g58307 [Rubroshorea leprosula]